MQAAGAATCLLTDQAQNSLRNLKGRHEARDGHADADVDDGQHEHGEIVEAEAVWNKPEHEVAHGRGDEQDAGEPRQLDEDGGNLVGRRRVHGAGLLAVKHYAHAEEGGHDLVHIDHGPEGRAHEDAAHEALHAARVARVDRDLEPEDVGAVWGKGERAG